MRPLSVLGIRTLSSSGSGTPDVDQGLVLRYLDKVKRRSEALQCVQGTRLSTEDASFMRRYRTLQPHVEKLDATLAEKEELRDLLLSEEVGRRQTKPPTVPRNSGSCNHPSFCFKEDGDFAEAVKNDLKALDAKITQIAEDVVLDLLPREAYDASDAVLEVVPGAGGGEAGIFAQEIFDLYTEYTRHLGFEVAVVEYSENTVKGSVRGITKAVAHVGGRGASPHQHSTGAAICARKRGVGPERALENSRRFWRSGRRKA